MYEKACQLFEVLPAPFEDTLIGFLVLSLQWIEHVFLFVNGISEHMFVVE